MGNKRKEESEADCVSTLCDRRDTGVVLNLCDHLIASNVPQEETASGGSPARAPPHSTGAALSTGCQGCGADRFLSKDLRGLAVFRKSIH